MMPACTRQSIDGGDVALERGAGAEGDDGDAEFGTAGDDLGDFLRGGGEHHRIGHADEGQAFAVTMLLADRVSDGDGAAEAALQGIDEAVEIGGVQVGSAGVRHC
jgi:hypothetical protein